MKSELGPTIESQDPASGPSLAGDVISPFVRFADGQLYDPDRPAAVHVHV